MREDFDYSYNSAVSNFSKNSQISTFVKPFRVCEVATSTSTKLDGYVRYICTKKKKKWVWVPSLHIYYGDKDFLIVWVQHIQCYELVYLLEW